MADIRRAFVHVVTIDKVHFEFGSYPQAEKLFDAILASSKVHFSGTDTTMNLIAWSGHPNSPDSIGMIIRQTSLDDD